MESDKQLCQQQRKNKCVTCLYTVYWTSVPKVMCWWHSSEILRKNLDYPHNRRKVFAHRRGSGLWFESATSTEIDCQDLINYNDGNPTLEEIWAALLLTAQKISSLHCRQQKLPKLEPQFRYRSQRNILANVFLTKALYSIRSATQSEKFGSYFEGFCRRAQQKMIIANPPIGPAQPQKQRLRVETSANRTGNHRTKRRTFNYHN